MIWRGWRREMLDRAQTSPDSGEDGFEERALWLGTTFGGAGRLQGDLTPACAAALTVVLDALGAEGGAGRYPHRGAAPARCDRGSVPAADRRADDPRPGRPAAAPDRAHRPGRPAPPPGGSALERSWTPARAAAGPGSAYLTGPAAGAAACDAVLTTIVTGQIDWTCPGPAHHRMAHRPRPPPPRRTAAGLKTTWTDRGKARRTAGRRTTRDGPQEDQTDGPQEDHTDGPLEDHTDGPQEDHTDGPQEDHRRAEEDQTDGPEDTPADASPESRDANQPAARPATPVPRLRRHVPGSGTGPPWAPAGPPPPRGRDCAISGCLEATRQRLQATILRWSLDLLSGPGGLASHLRGTLLGAPFNTPSQPLDLGRTTRTSRPTCAPPSSTATSTASSPAAPSHRPLRTCTT